MTGRQPASHVSRGRSRLLPLGVVAEPRGSLCVAEACTHVPFEIKRAYWVFGVPPNRERGHHAHREQQELLIAARGAFTVHCDEGNVNSVYRLDSSAYGLLLPELVWHHLEDFSTDALCLVLASGPYDAGEYVFDYDEFCELAGGT